MASYCSQKTVFLLCGNYMEDSEAMVLFQELLAFGVNVDAICPGKKAGDFCRTSIHDSSAHQTYSESRGHNFTLNATFDEVDFDKYDGLVIPGGGAPEYLAMNKSVLDCVLKFSDAEKPIASICYGQLILAAAGILKGRQCTAYPLSRPVIVTAGAHLIQPQTLADCVVDGNRITGVTYKGHAEFVQFFVKAIGGTITGSDKTVMFLCRLSVLCNSLQLEVPVGGFEAIS